MNLATMEDYQTHGGALGLAGLNGEERCGEGHMSIKRIIRARTGIDGIWIGQVLE